MLLSICIPTNGVMEWVFPVLDSIFSQNIESEYYEVIVTDNGTNDKFRQTMIGYVDRFPNLIYRKTNAIQFLNQIEAFKLASGEFIKFVNHRMIMRPGALQHIISFVKMNIIEKPTVFFLNGSYKLENDIVVCSSFDHFVRNLSYWSSWSAGIACWKSDFEKIPVGTEYNKLFPHTTILFAERQKKKYVIDNTIMFEELSTDNIAKGNYNLFYAFAVEYMSILYDLLRDGDISVETFLSIKDENFEFIEDLYLSYIFLKKKCSYDLSNYKEYLDIFYSFKKIRKRIVFRIGKRIIKKMRLKLEHNHGQYKC